ncbi:hypothetical protein MNBD_NITROSPINAE01-1557 [hydrothermal vent metagenome]|uniref:Type IV pilus biogenesis protein PilO n=1 Tax=hydrothermal vent metagenome TaxID=652676 RepID=A0A3B1C575_9ZZZZ
MLKNINPRERILIVSTIIFTLVVALWIGIYEPFLEKQEIMARKIEAKTKELAEVTALAKKLAREQSLINRFEMKLRKKPFKGSLLAKMESLAADAGIRKNIASMAPSPANEFDGYRESTVAIKIEKATLPGVVHFLESINATPGVMLVKRISIRPKYDDPSKLDVSLAISNYGFAK